MTDLAKLAKPFPPKFVRRNPSGGGDYVNHAVITQKLLATLGPYDFELVQIVRGDVPAKAGNPNADSARGKNGTPLIANAIVGAVCRITATVDGRVTRVEEVGDCEDPNNWPHDGARLKDAMSDALKRASMRMGLGLHLWSKEGEYVLDHVLTEPAAAPLQPTAPSTDITVDEERTVSSIIAEHFPGATEEPPTEHAQKEKIDVIRNHLDVFKKNDAKVATRAWNKYAKERNFPRLEEFTEAQADESIDFIESLS